MRANLKESTINYGGHAPKVRIKLNTGTLLDLASGTCILGRHGEYITNGGVPNITGVVARPNQFKTALLTDIIANAHHMYGGKIIAYDSDASQETNRFNHLYNQTNNTDIDLIESEELQIIDNTVVHGEEFHHITRSEIKRIGSIKDNKFITPFIGVDGSPMHVKMPQFIAIDTMTALPVDTISEKQEKHHAGDSKRNTEDMTKGKVKSQIISEMPAIANAYGAKYIMSAQLRDIIQMDPNAPPKKKLATLRADINIAGVPSVFYEQTNQLWCILSTNPLLNDNGEPDYPSQKMGMKLGANKKTSKDRDLTEIELSALRGKGNMSGIPIYLVGTQTDGINNHLSRWHYLRRYSDETTKKPYGTEGSNTGWFLSIYPSVKFTRVNVNDTIDDDPKLRRALEITSDIHQLLYSVRSFPRSLLCDPKTLYEDLIALGYDWDKILTETRGVWLFGDGDLKYMTAEDKWPLTTADLLNIRAGGYTPYWLEKAKWPKPKATTKPTEVTTTPKES
jgi:hypothetical protein